ncbi:MAG: sugar phosphate isomerase/epimerase [Clostridia bacterium]|nr:sugar phosphate isomerase/epimerase [Clostridia bacterium]
MLKIGILSEGYFGFDDYKDGLIKIKSHGYDCIDYSGFMSPESPLYRMGGGEFSAYLGKVRKAADEAGVDVWQLHGMWPHDDTTPESCTSVLERHKKALIGAGMLGCKYFVIHPAMPFGWGKEPDKQKAYDTTAERFSALLPVAKDTGITLCIENMPFSAGHSFSSIKEIKDIVRRIDDKNVKACFDTGHCNVTGENQREAIVLLGEDLAALHVHDDKGRCDRHLMPYQGEINWEDFIDGLAAIKFDGCISLETCAEQKTPEPIREKLRALFAETAKYLAAETERRK